MRLLPANLDAHHIFAMPSASATSAGSDELEYYKSFHLEFLAKNLAILQRIYAGCLLYADRVVDTIHPALLDRDPVAGRTYILSYALRLMLMMRPLIESGTLIIAGQPDFEPALAEVSDAERVRFGDQLMDVEKETNFYWDAVWNYSQLEYAMVRLNMELAHANRADATIVPTASWHWQYVAFREQRLLHGRSGADVAIRIASGLAHADLPLLTGLTPDVVVRIRKEEEAFAEWRNALRTAARTISSLESEDTFAAEAREVFGDLLESKVADLRRVTSRSRALRGALTEQPLRVALGAAFSSAAGVALGTQPSAAVVVGAAATGLANLAYAAIRPQRPTGAAAILDLLS